MLGLRWDLRLLKGIGIIKDYGDCKVQLISIYISYSAFLHYKMTTCLGNKDERWWLKGDVFGNQADKEWSCDGLVLTVNLTAAKDTPAWLI